MPLLFYFIIRCWNIAKITWNMILQSNGWCVLRRTESDVWCALREAESDARKWCTLRGAESDAREWCTLRQAVSNRSHWLRQTEWWWAPVALHHVLSRIKGSRKRDSSVASIKYACNTRISQLKQSTEFNSTLQTTSQCNFCRTELRIVRIQFIFQYF